MLWYIFMELHLKRRRRRRGRRKKGEERKEEKVGTKLNFFLATKMGRQRGNGWLG